MKKTRRRGSLLLLTLVFAMLLSMTVFAAAKPKLSKTKLTTTVGKKTVLQLKNITAKQAKTIKWTTSDKKVATVSKTGKVTAKKAGKAKITATYQKKKYTCVVTVKAKSTATAAASAGTGSSSSGTVYWVPSGQVYHNSRGCRSLARSSYVLSGTVAESGKSRVCKNCS